MEVGTGIFLGCVVLGVTYLYVKTREVWNWKKIAKRTLIGVVGATVACVIFAILAIAIDEMPKRPSPVTEINGIALGEKTSDVFFKKGKFSLTNVDEESGVISYSDNEKLEELSFKTKDDTVIEVGFTCHDISFAIVNGVHCGDRGDEIQAKFNDTLDVLCEKSRLASETLDTQNAPGRFDPQIRLYVVKKYNTIYVLQTNTVAYFTIASPERIEEKLGKHWGPCK